MLKLDLTTYGRDLIDASVTFWEVQDGNIFPHIFDAYRMIPLPTANVYHIGTHLFLENYILGVLST